MPFKNNKGVHRQSIVRSILTALGISVQTSCSVGSASPTAMGQCGTFNRRTSTVVGLQTSCGGLAGWENHAGSLLLLTHFHARHVACNLPTLLLETVLDIFGDPLMCCLYWDPCRAAELFGGALPHNPHPLLHRDLHKPLVPAWKRAQPSVLVLSLIF